MRKCPICGEVLVRIEYEGVMVMECPDCHGHLVDNSAVERIKRSEQTPQEELQKQIETKFDRSSDQELKCPRCKMSMAKQSEVFPNVDMELALDNCSRCALIWFDGGELAQLKLGYESTDQAAEARRMKQVHAEFEADPERQEEFAYNLSFAKKESDILSEGIAEGFKESYTERRTRWGIIELIIRILLRGFLR